MPKKSQHVGGLTGQRVKITVDLCPESADALQKILDSNNAENRNVGISPIVRAALIDFYRCRAWQWIHAEGLAAAKRRADLRKLTAGDQPTNDENHN